MPRMVKKEAQAPFEIKIGDETRSICACGLSQNQPFCDGSHKKTLTEDAALLYEYDAQGRKVIKKIDYQE